MYKTFKIFREKIQLFSSPLLNSNINPSIVRLANSQKTVAVTEAEIIKKLRQNFPEAKVISVEDISGGCGAMFNISVEANEFRNLSVIKQHRMIYDVLKEQIASIHGLHLETSVPK